MEMILISRIIRLIGLFFGKLFSLNLIIKIDLND